MAMDIRISFIKIVENHDFSGLSYSVQRILILIVHNDISDI